MLLTSLERSLVLISEKVVLDRTCRYISASRARQLPYSAPSRRPSELPQPCDEPLEVFLGANEHQLWDFRNFAKHARWLDSARWLHCVERGDILHVVVNEPFMQLEPFLRRQMLPIDIAFVCKVRPLAVTCALFSAY